MTKPHDLYRGAFDFPGKLKVVYRPGATPKHAWVLMCNAIAKEQGVPVHIVMEKFDFEKKRDVQGGFQIEIETEWKEKEEK